MTVSDDTQAAIGTGTGGRQRVGFVLMLGALIALGPMTMDLYLPALPTITNEFLTTEASVQLTITGQLAGLAIGQLVIGPLADRFGRKRPLLIGVGVHVLASLLCIVAPSVAVLGGLRVLQGLGCAAGAVIAMAIVRDLYTGRPAAILLSRLLLVMGAAPVLAPSLGAGMLTFTSWRGLFGVLALYGLVIIPIAARFLPETLPPERRLNVGPLGVLRTYGGLLHDRAFVGLMLATGLTMSAMTSYVSGAAFVFQEQYHLDQQQFGLVFSSGAIWLIISSQINPLLLRRYEPYQILITAVAVGVVATIGMFVVAATGAGGMYGLMVSIWFVLLGAGMAMPNAPAIALSRHGRTAGTAAALLGFTQFGTGALISPLVGVLGNDGLAMATTMFGGLSLALVLLVTVVRPWQMVSAEPVPATV